MDPERTTLAEVKDSLDRGVPITFVDVRSRDRWDESDRMIPEAIRVEDVDQLSEVLRQIPRDRPIIVYDDAPNEEVSAGLARRLLDYGFQEVYPLQGGFDAWMRAGYPTKEKPTLH